MKKRNDPEERQRQTDQPNNAIEPDTTPRREGGDEAAENVMNDQGERSLSQNPLYKGGNKNTSIETDDV